MPSGDSFLVSTQAAPSEWIPSADQSIEGIGNADGKDLFTYSTGDRLK